MLRREEEKTQKVMAAVNNSPFSDAIEPGFPLTGGIFDFTNDGGGNRDSLGFMDLLSLQGFPQSFFDVTPPPHLQSPAIAPPPESSETANLPATPNSSSISSSSADADPVMPSLPTATPFETVDDDGHEVDRENKIRGLNSKGEKKKGQKRQREPIFAFMTKSEVDHLEDGYRWRKYGQKAVKNSPFPRGYYRCTSVLCGVKKRVERSSENPTVVVTTYEGQHTHPIPIMPRGTHHLLPPIPPVLSDLHRLQAHHPIFSSYLLPSHPSDFQLISGTSTSQPPANVAAAMNDERRYCKPTVGSGFHDHGLLQDLIPSELMKNEQ